jgi:ribosomal protein L7/L12
MDQNQLINMLKLAYNDEDRGWNNAIITMLKYSINNTDLDPQIIYNARISFTMPLTADSIKYIHECFIKGSKLSAVKKYKEISGLGLKESKEECDKFFEICSYHQNQQ